MYETTQTLLYMSNIKISIFGTASTGKTIYQNVLYHSLMLTGNPLIPSDALTAQYFTEKGLLIDKLSTEDIKKQIGSTGQTYNLKGMLNYKGDEHQLTMADYIGESVYASNLLADKDSIKDFLDSDGIICLIDAETAVDNNGVIKPVFMGDISR
jgi:GTPase SAR1 family protein